eukprot:jgi/Bigna1/126076/aug1.2_g784
MGLTYYNSRPSSLYCCKLPEPETASSTVDGSDNKDATVHSQGKGRGGGDEKGGGGEGGGNNSGDWQVLTVDSSALNPRFSPDGKKLLYTSTECGITTRALVCGYCAGLYHQQQKSVKTRQKIMRRPS